jgi:hypothetical protein
MLDSSDLLSVLGGLGNTHWCPFTRNSSRVYEYSSVIASTQLLWQDIASQARLVLIVHPEESVVDDQQDLDLHSTEQPTHRRFLEAATQPQQLPPRRQLLSTVGRELCFERLLPPRSSRTKHSLVWPCLALPVSCLPSRTCSHQSPGRTPACPRS